MPEKPCEHILAVTSIVSAEKHECEECMKVGGRWVHLRTCQTCGVTLCCDSSPAKHMTAHFHATGHPVIASAEPGEQWLWCNADESFATYD